MLIYLREEAGVPGIDESGGNRVSLAGLSEFLPTG
jgi:hypothetical protein